ncbi:class I SAM-dependent methyltransferase [Novosphingobium aquiterrae]|uniref:Class I SAM-dependent methyltransferase n=1 Tax=Novosphingobium aquiterrae TaxID=624388 RepID=A0ABV6PL89_9SPHN
MNAPLTRFGLPQPTPDELEGRALYGDAFTPEEMARWFANEEAGYHALATTIYQSGADDPFESLHSDAFHFYRHLKGRTWPTCLAFGCADARDVEVLAPRVDQFIAIEPARAWWRETIGGKPARFMAPRSDGKIDLPDGSVDLVTVYSVLHHIPNVSTVVGELARVLRSGGQMLLREPAVSMGDFTQPRVGLTAHERGIPPRLLERMFAANGLTIVRRAPMRVGAFSKVLGKLGLNANSATAVRADAVLSRVLGFNMRYWRRNVRDRLGPATMAYILEKG